jgi:hypothetical protein
MKKLSFIVLKDGVVVFRMFPPGSDFIYVEFAAAPI